MINLFGPKKDSYKSLLKELKKLNEQIVQLNTNIKAVKNKIIKGKDNAAADKIRKKIGIKK